MDARFDQAKEDLWVFAYGSLMWRPGFDFLERTPALLIGAHRALCVLSHVHRGTPERPGLVLGLDHGGACRGLAYRVAAAERGRRPSPICARASRSPWCISSACARCGSKGARRRVSALCYVVDRGHAQYAGRLSLDAQLHHVRQGHGRSGANRDYVLAAVQQLEALGYHDRDLHLLAERLHGVHESAAQPG